ncbi:MAG: branched-chain amino acid ABC transporter permease [Proteobacteria bacterium]|nr:branched-chain amino acid ABC transporter permease [Pseudomonadota bacterium]
MLPIILIKGAMIGAVYASLAVGFSLVFGVAKIINLAHTAFFMLAAYAMYVMVMVWHWPVLPAVGLMLLGMCVLAILVYLLLLDRIREHEGAVILVTVALAVAFQEIVLLIFESTFRAVGPFLHGIVEILGVTVPRQELLIFGVTMGCLAAVLLFLYKTRLGLALRVTAQDRETANLMGINVKWVCLVSVVVAVTLAAVAGAVVSPTLTIEPYMWSHPLVMMFAAVILGGLGSVKGSFIGAFILGYTEVLVVFLVPAGSFIKGSVAMVIMVVILLVRPEGLYGVVFEEERL